MDMAAPKGTPIYAAETGVVIVAQSWSGYGNCVIIDHGGGLWTLYGHMSQILAKKGETVKRGREDRPGRFHGSIDGQPSPLRSPQKLGTGRSRPLSEVRNARSSRTADVPVGRRLFFIYREKDGRKRGTFVVFAGSKVREKTG